MRYLVLALSLWSSIDLTAQLRNWRFIEPHEYDWRWVPERSETWDAFPEHGLIALDETEIHDIDNFQNELKHEISSGRDVHKSIKFHFRTEEAIQKFMDQAIYLSPYYTLLALDGRIIHENGEVTDLTRREFPAAVIEAPHRKLYLLELRKRNIHLVPGDQLEMVFSYRIWSLSLLLEASVHASYPIRNKSLMIRSTHDIIDPRFITISRLERTPIEVFTYNNWPVCNIERTDRSTTRSWQFSNLSPLPASPYKIAKSELPFYSISMSGHMNPSMLISFFDHRFPYTKYSGRKNIHAFLDHINARKRVLKDRPVADLVRDIVKFVNDSIKMVPDEEMEPATPIGCHFHDRKLSPEKTVVLYRQLMSILEIPLYVCFTRDRYEGEMSQDTAYAEDLDTYVLAFRDPGTTKLHFITPNDLTYRYLMDELPYWVLGQNAIMMELKNGNERHGMPEQIKLPSPRPQDNLLSERIMIEVSDPSQQNIGRGRGTMTGQIRMIQPSAQDQNILDRTHHGNMIYPPERHKALDSVITDTTRSQTNYQFRVDLSPSDPLSWSRSGTVEFDLRSLAAIPTFGNMESIPDRSLLPYQHVSRTDIHMRFNEPVEFETSMEEITIENMIGDLKISCTLNKDQNSIHWHLEHILKNTWIDTSTRSLYSELMASLDDPRNYTVRVRRANVPVDR